MAVDTSCLHIKAMSSSLPLAPLPSLETKLARNVKVGGFAAEDKKGTARLHRKSVLKEEAKISSLPVKRENESVHSRVVKLFGEPRAPQTWSLEYYSRFEHILAGGLPFPGRPLKISAAVQSSPPPMQKQDDPEEEDYYVNVGYAIRTLRDELPTLFYKDLTYDIYRKDLVFHDPMHVVSGLVNYKLIFHALRFHGRIFFKALWVDILRIWQPSDNVIMVRWQVRGVPRVPWEAQGVFDATSEYKLDKHGKIYEHKVDNVALNSRRKFMVPTVAELLTVGACPSTPKPTFFGKSGSFFWALLPYCSSHGYDSMWH